MRITKEQLKIVVRECLVEILAEGIGPSTARSINEAVKNKTKSYVSTPTLSTRQDVSRTRSQSSEALKEAIRIESGGNDVMATILADTAANTLPMMLENEGVRRPMMTGKIESITASHTPEELFGEETTSKWANLAFAGVLKK